MTKLFSQFKALTSKEWHEIFLKMLGSTSMITFIIYMSCLIIYILCAVFTPYFIVQGILIGFSFVSLFILVMQTFRSMYHIYYLPLINSCEQTYQKIIFFCCSFSMTLIIISSFLLSFTKMLNDYYN